MSAVLISIVFILVLGLVIAGVIIVVGIVGGDIELSDILPNKDKDQKDWNRFDKKKPLNAGWYLCTVEQGSRFNMLLYWDYSGGGGNGRFVDPVRKSVFDTYEVMVTKKFKEGMATDAIMPNDEYMERIYKDDACDRTDCVIAWKPEPKVFIGEVQNNRNAGRDRANQVTINTGHNSEAIVNKLTEGLEQRMKGKKYDLSLEEVDEIVSKYVSRGSNGMCTADDLRAALIKAETINIHSNK